MKKKKFLSTLVIGALLGAMTFGATNPANASDSTDVTVNITGSGDGSSWTYSNGYADASMDHKLNLGKNGNIPTASTYDEDVYWDRGTKGGTNAINMSGGQLSITGFDNSDNNHTTGKITATGGKIILNNNYLTIGSDSSISSGVELQIAGGSTVRLTGGDFTINDGDTISGAINATAGTFTTSGTRTLNSANYSVSGTAKTIIDGDITSNISLAGSGGITVNSGKKLTISADNVDAAMTNNGDIALNAGILGKTISGNGATEIKGAVTNNSTITQSTGGVKISSGSLTTNAANVSGTVTNNVVDGYILTNGTNTNTITKTGTTGSTKIDAGTNTVINQAAIQQDLHVATGTFNNSTGGSVTGNTAIDSGSTVDNTAGALNTVTNNGTLNVSGGTVTSVTNNATGTQGVNHSGGTVSNVTNSGGVYRQSGGTAANVLNQNSGTYNLTNGAVTNFTQTGGTLKISNGATLTVSDATNPLTTAKNAITNGYVVLGDDNGTATTTDDTAGTLIISNSNGSSVVNQAQVTTVGSADNVFQIVGANTTFTTLEGTNIAHGSVVVGNAADASTLNLANNSIIAKEVNLTIATGSTMNINGTAQATINTGDHWNGAIAQSSTSTMTFLDNVVKDSGNATYTVTGGTVKVGDGTTAGTLTLNNGGDSIAEAAKVTIYAGSQLAMSNGSVTLDNNTTAGSQDTWNGAINLSGTGNLTLSGRTDVTDSVTPNPKTYNQSGGKLTVNNGGSLTLNTSASKIDGNSEVQLGSGTTAGALVLNNSSDNLAKITTAGTNTSNSFMVKGANTTFTALTGTNFANGSVTVGDGSTASTFNLSNDAVIADAAKLTVDTASKLVVNGTNASATINGTGATSDVWNGAIEQSAGTMTHLNTIVKGAAATYKVTDGVVKIGDGTTAGTLTLNNAADSIAKAANVTVNADSKLAMSNGNVLLDNDTTAGSQDVWSGAIELSGGTLELNGRTDTTNTATPNPKTYNQTGGILNLESSNLDIATSNSKINGGDVNIKNSSTLTLENGVANTAKVVMSDGTASTLNIVGASSELTTSTGTNLATGTINLGDGTNTSKLNLANNGIIAQPATLNVAKASELNISGTASAVIDSATDTYTGDVNVTGGALEMRDLTVTTGDVKTSSASYTGTNPYYSQTGGALTLTNTKMSMVDSSLISGGDLTVDTSSTFNSLSNSFSVANLANAGLINGINGGYENYAVSTGFYAGDALGDKQGDFTTDLYARCDVNNNFKYDSYGSDGATIYASDASKHGILNVSDWTLNGDIYGWDAPIDRSYNMNKLFKGTVAAGHTIDFTSTDKEVFTPIGWYGLHSNGGGNYSFSLNRYNPSVFRGQVTTIAQYQNQLMIDDILFNHTMLDQGFKGNDYIASNPNRLASANDLYPPYQYSRKDGGIWVKMYGTFEKLNMNHGLNVGNNAYGTLIGVDFGLKDLKHGWQFMPTAYVGYNGAHQYWNGYGAYQNGGQLGVMGTWYKNNFMIGALAYGGVYGNEMSTPRGDDNAFNYFAGGSVKGAYNWRFAKDWSLQPNLMVAYNFFGQQNWHSDFGQMGMMSGMLNGINIAPGLNLIWEKETFSIYATLQYMYNLNQSAGGRAGHVDLPNVHMDRGYIQYGLGVNKKFTDRFSGFLQAVIRNVGRNGVGLQAGFQWQLGKGSSNAATKNGNVTPELKKTEILLNDNKVQ